MPDLGRFSRVLRALLWKPSVRDEVHSELQYHLEMLEQDLIAGGLDPAAARAAARARFGDAGRLEDTLLTIGEGRDRERRRAEWLGELRQDIRYALRQLRANPRFTIVAVLTLALGLGASTTIFGIANALLLRPLPFREPDRLVLGVELTPAGQPFSPSEPDFLDWRARARDLVDLAAFAPSSPSVTGDAAAGGDPNPEQLAGARVTHSFFSVLGVAPAMGRAFTIEEDTKGNDNRVAVISHALWQRRFGGDSRVLQRTLDLDGVRHRVIGVMPRGFNFPYQGDVWTPLAPSMDWPRADRRLDAVVGRLAPGATIQRANAELAQIERQLGDEYPADAKWSANAFPIADWYVSTALRARIIALLATVGLLLLMACVNVASLLLARAGARQRELAIRAALGAGRRRIVRQLLTESLVLSVLGAAAGIALTAATIPIVRQTGSAAISLLADLSIDWHVLAFALGACVTTGIVFGLAPALRLSRGAHAVLRSGARIADFGRLRGAFVVSSVALAMLMLVGAALVGRSFQRLMRVDLGFSTDHVLTGSIVLPASRYDRPRSAVFFDELARRVGAIPGVRVVGATNSAPFSGGNTAMGWAVAGQEPANTSEYRVASFRTVTPGFFAGLRIPLEAGRLFDARDVFPAPRTIVISEAMARAGWPDGDPVGHEVKLGNGATATVIGVVGDTRPLSLERAPVPAMYFPHGEFPFPSMWLIVRTDGDPRLAEPAVRRELKALDPNLPFARAQPLAELVDNVTAQPRLTMLVFAIFASAALALAAVGLFGIVSYTVAQRTREIGVRLALGAHPRRIVSGVLAHGLRLAAVGIVLGAIAAYAAGGLLRAILFETSPASPAVFGGVAVLLVLVAATACAAPARRAARLDPVVALRSE